MCRFDPCPAYMEEFLKGLRPALTKSEEEIIGKVLGELEQWVFIHHEHHAEPDDEMYNVCEDHAFPYVNSVELVKKIREMKNAKTEDT